MLGFLRFLETWTCCWFVIPAWISPTVFRLFFFCFFPPFLGDVWNLAKFPMLKRMSEVLQRTPTSQVCLLASCCNSGSRPLESPAKTELVRVTMFACVAFDQMNIVIWTCFCLAWEAGTETSASVRMLFQWKHGRMLLQQSTSSFWDCFMNCCCADINAFVFHTS